LSDPLESDDVVGSGADDLERGILFERMRDQTADDDGIIDDQNPNAFAWLEQPFTCTLN
jgi:hypothetical protein